MDDNIKKTPWYPLTIAGCITVLFYVCLTHLDVIGNWLSSFAGFFGPIAFGCVLAYLINPLAVFLQEKVFKSIKNGALQWTLSIALALVVLLLVLAFLIGTVVPQLVGSIGTLVSNMNGYVNSLMNLAQQYGLAEPLGLNNLLTSSASILEKITGYLAENLSGILSYSAMAGKSLASFFIALILSIYLLASKTNIKRELMQLLQALLSKNNCERFLSFMTRCHNILIRYIVYSLLDSLIVGVANAIFMTVMGMQYVGLVSLVVAVTNLVPTFGPLIGGVIGAFVLLLVNPVHALIFALFTAVLQFMDGYVIKPKLFGDSLGVSGLLILAAVIVCGNMFGVVGILLAIPLAAILDFVYHDYILLLLEVRRLKLDMRKKKDAETKN